MATLLLLRHGRTTANAAGGLAGRRPVDLDDAGRAQAAEAGLRLRALPLTTVVTSPMVRCRRTLEIALPQVTPLVEEDLTECGYGAWEGRPLAELAKDPLWAVVQQHPSAAVFPEGESMAAMAARSVAAVRRWNDRVSAEHGPSALWLACAHGDIIKAIVADALGMHLDLFQRIVVDPGSVTAIRYTPTRPFLLRLNDTGGDLSCLVPAPAAPGSTADSDAVVGGGAGATGAGGVDGAGGAGVGGGAASRAGAPG